MFELNNKNVKKILLIITYAAVLIFALFNIKFVGYILNLLKPFIIGFAIAFILNIPLSKFESFWKDKTARKIKDKKGRVTKTIPKDSKLMRPLAIVFSLVVFIAIIAGVLLLVIPQVGNTVGILKENILWSRKSADSFL